MREVEITSIHRMTPRVKQFELVADETFEYEPGQHTQLHFERDGDGSKDGDGEGEGERAKTRRSFARTRRPGCRERTASRWR